MTNVAEAAQAAPAAPETAPEQPQPAEQQFDSAMQEAGQQQAQAGTGAAADPAATPPANENAPQQGAEGQGGGPTPPALPSPDAPQGQSLPPPPTQGDADPASQVTPERRQQIDQFVQTEANSEGMLWWRDSSAEKVERAMTGDSSLGQLSEQERAYLTDRSLDKWIAENDYGSRNELAFAAHDDPALSGVVGERYADRAAARMAEAERTDDDAMRADATNIAAEAVYITAGSPLEGNTNEAALSTMVGSLSTEEAGQFARALVGEPDDLARTMAALNQEPISANSNAFTASAWTGLEQRGGVFARNPQLGDAMGDGIARVWYPDSPLAQQREGDRLGDILQTAQGADLLVGGFEFGQVPQAARAEAMAILRANPSITAETLTQTGDVWTNPTLMTEFARGRAEQFMQLRGNEPLVLEGTNLDNTVGFALNLPAAGVNAETPAAQARAWEEAAARGEHSYYAEGPGAEQVRAVVDQIRAVGGDAPQVTVLPVQFSSGQTGPVQLSLFRVEGSDGRTHFVDNTGRRYDSFDDWKNNNELPPGNMTYVPDGQLTRGDDGRVRLESGNTPAVVDTLGEYVLQGADYAALAGGLVAGGAIILGSGGTAAPLVLGGALAWQGGRSASNLWDEAAHGESLNPFTNAEARGEWLNLGASALGLGALGAGTRVASLAAAGRPISPLLATTTAALGVGANTFDALTVANTGHQLITQWDQLSAGERAQLGLSMAFWGVSAFATSQATGTRPQDMFNFTAARNQLLNNWHMDTGRMLALPEVDALVQKSPTLQADLQWAQNNNWPIDFANAPRNTTGTFADPANQRINFDRVYTTETGSYVSTLGHEIAHAQYGDPPHQWTTGMTRQQYIDANVEQCLLNEGHSVFRELQIRDEILQNGGPDIGAKSPAYMQVWATYKANGNAAQAQQAFADLMGLERPSTNPAVTYREYYGEPFAKNYDAWTAQNNNQTP